VGLVERSGEKAADSVGVWWLAVAGGWLEEDTKVAKEVMEGMSQGHGVP
jgi:hypothetical protein